MFVHTQRYSLTITIDPKTLKELHDRKYCLYGFRGVSTEAKGKPAVWFANEHFGETNHIDWVSPIQAYGGIINRKLSDNSSLSFSLSKNINFGETLVLSDPNGLGYIEFEGDPNYFSITSECQISPSSGDIMACGLSSYSAISSQFTPFCVFPIENGHTYKMKSLDLIFLAFATENLATGSICSKLASEGVLIDMSSGERSISFKDLHWERSAGVETVKANTDLTSKLIRNGDNLVFEISEQKVPLKESLGNIGERRENREKKEQPKIGTETKEGLVPPC